MGYSFNPIQENDWQGLNIVLEKLFYGKAVATPVIAKQEQAIIDEEQVYMDEVVDPNDPDPEDPEPVVEEPTRRELREQKRAARKAAILAKRAERKAAREAKKAKRLTPVSYTETDNGTAQAELVELTGVVGIQGVDIYNKTAFMENVTLPYTGVLHQTLAGIAIPSSYYLDLRGIWLTTATAQYTADVLIAHNSDGLTLTLTDVDETNNVGTAGPVAGGRDQSGAFSASSWVHFFIIHNPITNVTSSLSSASPTAPTLPSGYTYFAKVGCLRFNGLSQLVVSYQMNDKITYNLQWPKWETHATLVEEIDISAYVPPTAKMVHGVIGLSSGAAARKMYAAANSGATIRVGAVCDNAGAGDTAYGVSGSKDFVLPLLTAQRIWWVTETDADGYALGLSGFTDDL